MIKTVKGESGKTIKYDTTKTFAEQDIIVSDILEWSYGSYCPIHDPIICKDEEGYPLCSEWGRCPEEKVEEAIHLIS